MHRAHGDFRVRGDLGRQQWDSTPGVPPGTATQVNIALGGGLTFDSAPTDIQSYGGSGANTSGWTAGMTDSWNVYLIGPEIIAQDFAWTLNFSSALPTVGQAQFQYVDNGVVVETDTWAYDGTGTGDNPVGSWHQVDNNNFRAATPEPAGFALAGSGLIGLAGLLGRRLRRKS